MDTSIPGVPTLSIPPSDTRITDRILFQQVLTLSRIWHFLYDADKGVTIKPDLMESNYGLLLCGSSVAPLAAEARTRAEQGSELFRGFFESVDALKAKRGGITQPDESFLINYVHDLKSNREIGRHDGRIDPHELAAWSVPNKVNDSMAEDYMPPRPALTNGALAVLAV